MGVPLSDTPRLLRVEGRLAQWESGTWQEGAGVVGEIVSLDYYLVGTHL